MNVDNEEINRRIEDKHRLVPSKSALLVIDMQHGFLDEGASLEVEAGRAIIPAIGQLINAFRGKKAPVIFTEFVYADNVPCLRGDPFGVEHLPAKAGEPTGLGHPSSNCLIGPNAAEGVESAETVEALAPLPGELVVQGHTYDKFYGTPLDLSLRSQGITHLVATGITTDVCVSGTVISGTTRDYRVSLCTDGVASPFPDLHDAALKLLAHKFARLKTSDKLIAELASF
ncbi:MAG: cysteine hydrolase [Verrucomicrobiota bacterium]|nr:cysteine hydrolase [Verrucomicrobiota bacterium]